MSRTLPSKRTRRWRVSRRDNGLLLSPAEFDAIDDWDENYSYELINGVLVVNPVPGPAEVDPNEELGVACGTTDERIVAISTILCPNGTWRLPTAPRDLDRAGPTG